MTLNEVRDRGIHALQRELGMVGMIRFLQQFESGNGDYTAEREQWLSRLSVEEAAEVVRKYDASKPPVTDNPDETDA
jgi:hypothetical protein